MVAEIKLLFALPDRFLSFFSSTSEPQRAADHHGCGDAPPCAWYQFSTDRKGEHPVNHLSGYTGTVHAGGFAGFNGLFGEDKAGEQASMIHVRRKF